MSLSPPVSRTTTPPTPLTGLTIPSPGPIDDPKSIQLPSSPTNKSSRDRPISPLEDIIKPTDIPLPPSPKMSKQTLPFRRPRVSNPLDRVVSATQRTSSGRRVSSALQYAMHPSNPEREAENEATGRDDSVDIDLAYYQEMVNEATSVTSDDDVVEIPPDWDSSLGFGGQVPDLVGDTGIVGDEDEAWMGYVRAQLNTLFPDYFDPSVQGEGEEGDISISTIASSDLATPPIGTRLGAGLGVGRGVPNIRDEIGGLTEEIERLRGVVSGLAEGMRAAQSVPGVRATVEMPRPEEEDAQPEVPQEFLKTAHLSMDIIRMVHTSLIGTSGPDSELFSEGNLTIIKHHFQALDQNVTS